MWTARRPPGVSKAFRTTHECHATHRRNGPPVLQRKAVAGAEVVASAEAPRHGAGEQLRPQTLFEGAKESRGSGALRIAALKIHEL